MSQTKAQLIDPVDGTVINAQLQIDGGNVTNSLEINGTGGHELYSYHDSGGNGWATGTGGSFGELLYLDESGSTVRLYSGGTERLKIDGTEVVVNDTGASVDFRVEGDTNTNLLFADASTDRVGIGHASPAKLLDVKGGDGATTEQYLRNNTVNLLSKIVTTTEAQFGTETSHPLVFLTGNTERIRVTASGNVTMPHQACMVFTNPSDVSDPSENTPLEFSGLDVSKGGMAESNNRSRITVPTAGTYLISALISGSILTASSSDGIEFHLRKNGSIFPSSATFPITTYGTTAGDEYYIDYTIIINLSANDYLEVALTNIDSSQANIQRGYFAVSLLH